MSVKQRAVLFGLLAGCAVVGTLGWFVIRGWGDGDLLPTSDRPVLTVEQPAGVDDTAARSSNSSVDPVVVDEQFAHSLESSRDYEDLRRRLEPLAARNDAVALRMLGEVYGYCAAYSLAPASARDTTEAMVKTRPENSTRLREIGDRLELRCRGLKGGAPIPFGEVELSWALAAQMEDPTALARMAARADELAEGALESVAKKAIESRDARAIFELGEVMHRHGEPPNYPTINAGRTSAYAMQVVACRRSPSMCEPSSPLMEYQCLYAGLCNFSSYEDLVRRGMLGQASLVELDRQISVINSFLARSGK